VKAPEKRHGAFIGGMLVSMNCPYSAHLLRFHCALIAPSLRPHCTLSLAEFSASNGECPPQGKIRVRAVRARRENQTLAHGIHIDVRNGMTRGARFSLASEEKRVPYRAHSEHQEHIRSRL
jgi:hypothetical protein